MYAGQDFRELPSGERGVTLGERQRFLTADGTIGRGRATAAGTFGRSTNYEPEGTDGRSAPCTGSTLRCRRPRNLLDGRWFPNHGDGREVRESDKARNNPGNRRGYQLRAEASRSGAAKPFGHDDDQLDRARLCGLRRRCGGTKYEASCPEEMDNFGALRIQPLVDKASP